MKKKKSIIGHYFSIKLEDWKEPVKGFLIAYNDEWVLMLHNPRDFIIDGYILFRYKYYESIDYSEKDSFTDKVLRLKGIPDIKSLAFPIDNLNMILTHISKKFGVFGLYRKPENELNIGKLKSLDTKQLVINVLDPKAQWDGTQKFRPGDIRVIEFGTDYNDSLLLIAKKKMPK